MPRTSLKKKAGRPADADSAQTRRTILRCALVSFAEKGFDGTTNKEIASAAGVTPAAIYHYFPSKADMFVGVCEQISDTIISSISDIASRKGTLVEKIGLLVDATTSLGRSQTPAMVFVTGMWHEALSHPEVREGTSRMQTAFRAAITDIVRSSDDAGRLLEGTTAEALADFLGSVLAGFGRMNGYGQHERQVQAGQTLMHLLRAASHN
jgi:AcrR family transcriptional regulator